MSVGGAMFSESLAAEPGLQRHHMSWEEYLALPARPKAEWIDGEVVVSPPVGWERLLRLDAPTPAGEVTVGDHGVVRVDLAEILSPR